MKKRTTALTLVLISPTLLAGCSSHDCDPKTEDCTTGRSGGYYGGGYYGGGARSYSGGSSAGHTSGGFGSTGHGFSSSG